MSAYIDVYRCRFGVGPICRTLRVSLVCGFLTPRAYWQAKRRAVSRMRARHEALARDIAMVHVHRFMAVYGYRKMDAQLIRQGWCGIGRDQVLRVMRSLGIRGVRRGRIPVTTRPARSTGGVGIWYAAGFALMRRACSMSRISPTCAWRPARSRTWRSSPTRTPEGSSDGRSRRANTPGRCRWSRWTSPSPGPSGMATPRD